MEGLDFTEQQLLGHLVQRYHRIREDKEKEHACNSFPNGVFMKVNDVTFHAFDPLWHEVARLLTATYFVPADQAQRLCVELFRGLVCKSFVRTTTQLGLPPQIDLAWHQAILNTVMYRDFCNKMFHRPMDHTTVTEQDSIEAKNNRVSATENIYRKFFNEEPPSDLWKPNQEDDEGDNEEHEDDKDDKSKKRAAPTTTTPNANAAEKKLKRSNELQLFVKTLTGKTITIYPCAHLPISGVKSLIQMREGIPPDQQRIIFAGARLNDDSTCIECGLEQESTLHLVMRVSGC
jgi:hypothetical protein